MSTPPSDSLLDAARCLGLLASYLDHTGTERHATAQSLTAVAAAVAGLPGAGENDVVAWVNEARAAAARRVVDEVVVLWQPGPARIALRHRVAGRVAVEVVVDAADPERGGEVHRLQPEDGLVVDLAPLALPVGRHRLAVHTGGRADEAWDATVVVAPRRVADIGEVVGGAGGDGVPPWGVFAPVWSAWTPGRPEVHLGSLDAVGAWVADLGGSLVGTLPLLATFADRPCDPSPYSPVSRRRWNEALVDLRAAPGFDSSESARALAAGVAPADPAAPWDPVAHWAAVRPVLAALAEQARTDDAAAAPVLAALGVDPELGVYAWFRAEVERTGVPWRTWSPGAAPPVDDVRADPAVWRWAWAQWVVATQLAGVSRRCTDRSQALYLDLALGAHADGFDTWSDPTLYGWGASVGAPPDAMFGGGQDWGFPPVRPAEARASGHEEWALALRAHASVCGVLRLDHVLGLQRLFWIPEGASPTEGVYVRQPLDELLAVLAVEAHRGGAAVVGEDLGTVDPEVRRAMARHGVAGMYIAQFAVPPEPPHRPQWPGAGQLAAVNTHDMPTFAGWMSAADAEHRRRAGLIDDAGVTEVRRRRRAEVAALRAALGVAAPGVTSDPEDPLTASPVDVHPVASAGGSSPTGGPAPGWQELLAALVAQLGRSDAEAVLVSIDDLVGSVEQQNVPGTPWSRPNWVVRLPLPLGALAADDAVVHLLAGLDEARRSTAGRGRG